MIYKREREVLVHIFLVPFYSYDYLFNFFFSITIFLNHLYPANYPLLLNLYYIYFFIFFKILERYKRLFFPSIDDMNQQFLYNTFVSYY